MKIKEFIGHLYPIGVLSFFGCIIWLIVHGIANTFSLFNNRTTLIYVLIVVSWLWMMITSKFIKEETLSVEG